MKWHTLYRKLGSQRAKTLDNLIYARVFNPHTGRMDRINLMLKFDAYGKPYFVEERKEKR